jgi:hypothetical protein
MVRAALRTSPDAGMQLSDAAPKCVCATSVPKRDVGELIDVRVMPSVSSGDKEMSSATYRRHQWPAHLKGCKDDLSETLVWVNRGATAPAVSAIDDPAVGDDRLPCYVIGIRSREVRDQCGNVVRGLCTPQSYSAHVFVAGLADGRTGHFRKPLVDLNPHVCPHDACPSIA